MVQFIQDFHSKERTEFDGNHRDLRDGLYHWDQSSYFTIVPDLIQRDELVFLDAHD
jgi:hypothetical protein